MDMTKKQRRNLSDSIRACFVGEWVEQVARECGFVQRQSKVTGALLAQVLVFHVLENKEMTLASICRSCQDLGVTISEQGIDARLNDRSVEFMYALFQAALQRFRPNAGAKIPLLDQFRGVRIIDSTQISLSDSMVGLFPGSGGKASAAIMKVQLAFDYRHGRIEQVELHGGNEPDQGYRGYWSIIEPAALILFDLGYFALDSFKAISDRGGYFLSRFQPQTGLLEDINGLAGQRLALTEVLANCTQATRELNVLVGYRSKHQIACRLVMMRLPKEVADRQRQKAKTNAQRHNRPITKEYLALLDWAIFITNVPPAMLHTEHVSRLYRIRWQIELIFKLFKSFCGMTHAPSTRYQRVLAEFFARLITVVLTFYLLAPMRCPWPYHPAAEISMFHVHNILQRFARAFAMALTNANAFARQIDAFFRQLALTGFKQKRRKCPNAFYALKCISLDYEGFDTIDLTALA